MSNITIYFIAINLVIIFLLLNIIVSTKNKVTNTTEDSFSNKNKRFSKILKSLDNVDKGHRISKSKVYSYSYSSIGDDKKPESHMRGITSEEYIEKDGKNPIKIRKYGEFIKKDNDNPAIVKKKAFTNIEKEGLIIGNATQEKIIPDDDFKVKFY